MVSRSSCWSALVPAILLASCGASVRAELPLTPAEEALVLGIEGDWFGIRTQVDISPNSPQAQAQIFTHSRVTRVSSREFYYQWVSSPMDDLSRSPRNHVTLDDGRLVFDSTQVTDRLAGSVPFESSNRIGTIEHRPGQLTVDFAETVRQQNLTTTSRIHHRLIATRSRP